MHRKDRNHYSQSNGYLILLPALVVIIVSVWCALPVVESKYPGPVNRVSLIFIGDIMGHGSQIRAAWDDSTKTYAYNGIFTHVKDIISAADFAFANLEVTLSGEPYSSYPEFSSPDALASASQDAGIDCLVMANNHAADRGKEGIERTIRVVDSCGLRRTGVFTDSLDKAQHNPLYFEKNSIKIALLNYSYAVNGNLPDSPASINFINRFVINADIEKARRDSSDIIITYLHFGREYASGPDSLQVNLVEYLFESGSDIVIGSHPHVIQPLQFNPGDEAKSPTFVAYSLGNFVSGQLRPGTDGGLMVTIDITKDESGTRISDSGYYLTWVSKKFNSGKMEYTVIPCYRFEKDTIILNEISKTRMLRFIDNSRVTLAGNQVKEIVQEP